MPNTFTKIASVTVGAGGAASIDFTSIPSTYTDLVIKWSLRNTLTSFELRIQYNGVTSGYSSKRIYGDGTGVGSNTDTSVNGLFPPGQDNGTYTANTFSNGEIYIPNYASSNYKSSSSDTVSENNATTAQSMSMDAGIWTNTAAITSIKIAPYSNNFVQYSTATLYGIKNS